MAQSILFGRRLYFLTFLGYLFSRQCGPVNASLPTFCAQQTYAGSLRNPSVRCFCWAYLKRATMKNVNSTSKTCKCKLQARPSRLQMLSLMHYLQVQRLVPCLVLHNYSNSLSTILHSNTFACVGHPATSHAAHHFREKLKKSQMHFPQLFSNSMILPSPEKKVYPKIQTCPSTCSVEEVLEITLHRICKGHNANRRFRVTTLLIKNFDFPGCPLPTTCQEKGLGALG